MKNTVTRSAAALALSLGAFALLLGWGTPQAQEGARAIQPAPRVHAPPAAAPVPKAAPEVATAPRWSEDAHRLARLVANEDGLTARRKPDAERRIDAYLIAAVEQRNATLRDVSVAEIIARNHWRHTRPDRENGAWIPGLSTSLERPTGWPESRMPWDTDWRGKAAWVERLEEAESILAGEGETLDCPAAPPVAWGGPVTDHARLVARLSSGRFRIVAGPRISGELPEWRRPEEQCSVGGRTRSSNVFLALARHLDGGDRP